MGNLESMITKLVKPSSQYKDSFLEAMREFQADSERSRFGLIDDLNISEVENNFEKYLEKISNKEKGIGLEEGQVPASSLLLIEDGAVVGIVSLRHKLNEKLLKMGGHIGYGHQKEKWVMEQILEFALLEAKKLGIDRAMVSCDDDNVGSAKIIEKNGGILENKVEHEGKLKRRYWIENK